MKKVKKKIMWAVMVLTVSIMMTQNFNLLIANAENTTGYKAEEIIPFGEYEDVAIFDDGTILVYKSYGEEKEVSTFDSATKTFTKIGDYVFDNWYGIEQSEQIMIKKQDKYGIMNKYGKIVLECIYDEVTYFNEGLAGVKKDGKAGFVDETGNVIIPLEYDEVSQFSEGLAGVKKDGKVSYIDKTGNVVLSLEYDEVDEFSEGLAAVTSDGKVGYIDQAGTIIVPIEFNAGNKFSEGLAGVTKDGKAGFIDKKGDVTVPLEYDEVNQFSEGLAGVIKDGKAGYVDKIGNVVVPLVYASVTEFNQNFAVVSKNNQYSIIDKTGNEIVELKYDSVESKGNLAKTIKDGKVALYSINKYEQNLEEVDTIIQEDEIETNQDTDEISSFESSLNSVDSNEQGAISSTNELQVSYQTHSKDIGWQTSKANGDIAGITGQDLRLEAIAINIHNGSGMGIKYSTHIENIGWQEWKQDGQIAGTTEKGLQLEAIKIELTNAPKGYSIEYSVHVQDLGWQEWKQDGSIAGTTGETKRLEAIKIKIINENGDVVYQTHIQNYGWQSWRSDGDTAGTSGEALRLEGINIKLNNSQIAGGIKYSTHIQDVGWQDWKENGNTSGTLGESLRLEGIKIELVNPTNGYHVEYRVHIQDIGWQDWTRDGQIAGTTGQAKRLEAIEVRIVGDPVKTYTVMLDPGHEGKYPLDPGAVQNGLYEYQLNNSLVKLIAAKLEAQGYKVIYTHNPNIEGPAPLKQRDEVVNAAMPDLFISVHHDSSVSTTASGYSIHYSSYRYNIDKSGLYVIVDGKEYPFVSQSKRIVNGSEETYVTYSKSGSNIEVNINGNIIVKDRTPGTVAKNSEKFANILYSKLQTLDYIGARTNPVTDHNLYITRETNVPTVLFEAGYISNPSEAAKVSNAANQNKFADKVTVAINEYFK